MMPNHSLQSMGSNQEMDTEGNEELRKHLDDFINKEEMEYHPKEEEISLEGGIPFLSPMHIKGFGSYQSSPDLQHVLWTSMCIPVPKALANAMDAIFDMLDKFLTKMKEVDRCFMVFPHNISKLAHWLTCPTQSKNQKTCIQRSTNG